MQGYHPSITTVSYRIRKRLYFAKNFHYVGTMILHLFQQIPYISLGLSETKLPEAYLAVLSFIENAQTGSEACLVVDPRLKPLQCGYQNPSDEEDRILVKKLLPQKDKPHDFIISQGDYQLVQLQTIPNEGEIEAELSCYIASQSKNNLYIRMIKENAMELVIQLIWRS